MVPQAECALSLEEVDTAEAAVPHETALRSFFANAPGLIRSVKIIREIQWTAGDARSIVVTSRLTNTGSAPRKAVLQAHPEVRVGEFQDCILEAKLRNGSRLEDAFADHPAGTWWAHELSGG